MPKKSDLIVLASAKAKPGKEKDLERALRDVGAPTRAQPGSVAFSLYRSTDDPTVIVGVERWASAADHDRHLQGAHVRKLMSAMAEILAEPPHIVSYEILDE
jgi:quinol monooxygenase YgiN